MPKKNSQAKTCQSCRLEKDIQKDIMKNLNFRENFVGDVYVVRTNSAVVQVKRYGGSTGFMKTGRPGCPDITLCYNGYYVGLEVKTEKGRQSEDQKDTENYIKKIGGFYFVVRSVEDVENALHEVDKQIQDYLSWTKSREN